MARKDRQWAPFNVGGDLATAGMLTLFNIGADVIAVIAQSLRGTTVARILMELEFMPAAVLASRATQRYALGLAVMADVQVAAGSWDPSGTSGGPWIWSYHGHRVPLAVEVAAGSFVMVPFYHSVDTSAMRKVGAGQSLWLVVMNLTGGVASVQASGWVLLLT